MPKKAVNFDPNDPKTPDVGGDPDASKTGVTPLNIFGGTTPTSGLTTPTVKNPGPPMPTTGGLAEIGSTKIAFCGGGRLTSSRNSEPMSTNCYRPTDDLKTQIRIEEICVKPLEEARRIDEGKCAVTYSDWLKDVERHCIETGLDGCAYILKSTNARLPSLTFQPGVDRMDEVNLFRQHGAITSTDIECFELAVKITTCQVEKKNQNCFRRFLRGSVGPILQARIDRELEATVSGSRCLHFIMSKLQPVLSLASRKLVKELEAIKLSTEAGCHVGDCAAKIHNLCTKIEGLGTQHVPNDLSFLVVQCFDTTGVQHFDMDMVNLQNEIDNGTAHTWTEILKRATTKFDQLHTTDRWPPLAADAKTKAAAASGFAVQFKELQKNVKDLKSQIGSNKSSTTTPSKDLSHVTCHYCKKTGHYKSDCPSLSKKSGGGDTSKSSDTKTGEGSGSKSDSKSKSWRRIPPNDGAPLTKKVTQDGKEVTAKWCGKCRRWNTDPSKAHVTDEHVSKKTDSTPTAAANSLSHTSGVNFGLFTAIDPSNHLQDLWDNSQDLLDDDDVLITNFSDDVASFPMDDCAFNENSSNDGEWHVVQPGKGTPIHDAIEFHPNEMAGRW